MYKTRMSIANNLMLAGLLPYIAVFIYFALMSDATGDAGTTVIFMTILGLGISYLVALGISFPAYLWSRSMAASSNNDTRYSVFLRRSVLCGVLPVFAVFPCFARYLFW